MSRVGLCGFLLLAILAYRTYTDEPPIPSKVTGANGQLLFTGEEVSAGREVFLKNGVMEYGSIFGHGAYLGPDFTADYLHRAALIANDLNGSSSQTPRESTIADFKANRYDATSLVLTYSAAQTEAFNKLVLHYGEFFAHPTRETACGRRPSQTRSKSSNSPPFPAGRRGQLLPCAPISITPIRTIGPPNHWWEIMQPPTR